MKDKEKPKVKWFELPFSTQKALCKLPKQIFLDEVSCISSMAGIEKECPFIERGNYFIPISMATFLRTGKIRCLLWPV